MEYINKYLISYSFQRLSYTTTTFHFEKHCFDGHKRQPKVIPDAELPTLLIAGGMDLPLMLYFIAIGIGKQI